MRLIVPNLIFAFFFGLSLAASAQTEPTAEPTAPAPRLIPWRGLVQFRAGDLVRINSAGQSMPLGFRDAIYEGDRVELRSTDGPLSSAKIHSRENCAIALYARSKPMTVLPPDGANPWRIRGEAIRLHCPKGESLKIEFRGADFIVGGQTVGGDVLIDGLRLLVVGGRVQANGGSAPALQPKVLYRFEAKSKAWTEETTDPLKLFEFHTGRPLLAETERLVKPNNEKTWRLILGPSGGSTNYYFDNSAIDASERTAEGGRIHTQIKWGEGSFIAMLHFRNNDEGSDGPPPDNSVRVKGEFIGAEFGYRMHHKRWYSPFFRFGFGREQPKVQLQYPSESLFRYEKYEFHSLALAGGVDAFYSPDWLDWFGFYGSAEMHLTHSLGRGAAERQNSSSSTSATSSSAVANEPWRATALSFLVHIGLLFQF